MYAEAHIGDIRKVDNAEAEGRPKSDKTPIGRCYPAVAITPISICRSCRIVETRSEYRWDDGDDV
jgi:hypothetical protein